MSGDGRCARSVLAAISGQVCRSATASARPVSSSRQEPLTDIGRTTNFDIPTSMNDRSVSRSVYRSNIELRGLNWG
jgi:hypothetical protein